jgi:hypothetical protein
MIFATGIHSSTVFPMTSIEAMQSTPATISAAPF